MPKSLVNEQLFLLRFEKQLAGLAGILAATTSASAKSPVETSAKQYDNIREALVRLADVTSSVHAAIQSSAGELGLGLLKVGGGGTPKDPPSVVVRSLLGIG